jgi:2-polyprenyl-3-methyl-5-hydroxy-6-metoxy-1,4-benzoquinol methylase
MPSVEEHYKNLLAPYYTWIQGGNEQQLSAHRDFFGKHNVRPAGNAVAVDLGAGSGFQSIPLSELGFQVIAIDLSRELLDELRQSAGSLSILAIQDDLLNFSRHTPAQAELIVCMGDTLTHLPTLPDVQRLITDARSKLAMGGRLLLGFRDMSVAAKDLDRFIAVRSDAERIFTCFLEYEERHVRVYDLVYERCEDQWLLRKSFFQKLRIATSWLQKQIQAAGLRIEHLGVDKGLTSLIARKH